MVGIGLNHLPSIRPVGVQAPRTEGGVKDERRDHFACRHDGIVAATIGHTRIDRRYTRPFCRDLGGQCSIPQTQSLGHVDVK